MAEVLVRMGLAHTSQGKDEEGLVFFEEAEAIQRAAPGHPHLAEVLIGKGTAYWGQGDFDRAVEVYEEAAKILEPEGRPRYKTLAATYLNLGTAYWSKNDYDQARVFWEKTLVLQGVAVGEKHREAGITHFNLAALHLSMGNSDACVASAQRALEIFLPVVGERHSLIVQSYNVMGQALAKKGDLRRGLQALEKALRLQEQLSEASDRDSALIYGSLGDLYRAKGDLPRAVRHYRKALEVDRSIYGERHPDRAEDLINLGNLALDQGALDQALGFFAQAITVNHAGPVRSDPDLDPPFDSVFSEEFLLKALKGAARTRGRRAVGENGGRELEAAARVYEHASRLIDHMRAGYRTEGSKLSLASSAAEIYDEAIRTELELHRGTGLAPHLEAAFRYAEKSKAGVLREALNEAEARSFAGIPQALLAQERKLRIDLASVDRRYTEAQLERGVREEQLTPLREKQFVLKREYDALRQRFEKEYPEYYDLKYRSETAGPSEIREQALDERTVLVEYFLGKERIFIFTITPQDLQVTSVAREASLEDELWQLRQAITARDFGAYAPSAHRPYRLLLAPVEGRLLGRDLIVVRDGSLSTVPFEALLTREANPRMQDATELPVLLRDHAVSYAYSATVLLQGRDRKRERPPDALVAFAPSSPETPPPPRRRGPCPPHGGRSGRSVGSSPGGRGGFRAGSRTVRGSTSTGRRRKAASSQRRSSAIATSTSPPTGSWTRSIPACRGCSSPRREPPGRMASSTSGRSTTCASTPTSWC
jgi:tetratricopeptide (TPR) repeat protein